MTSPDLSQSESGRLAALQECRILDTPGEQLFEELTQLAALATGAPVALLSFFDADREWVKARFRWNVSYFPRELSLGTEVVKSKRSLVVDDLAADSRFADHNMVVNEPKIRFYAAYPVTSFEGHVLGVLAVYDRAPRSLGEAQQKMLSLLAAQASAHVNARRRLNALTEEVAQVEGVRIALRESDERFRELFDNVDDFIMTILADGTLLHVNSASRLAFATAEREIDRASIFELVAAEDRDDFRAAFERVVQSGNGERVEAAMLQSEGRRIVVEGTLVPKVVDGFTLLVRVIFRDVTDRKQIAVELAKARDAALESARLKSQFLTNMSHEIRTPIHALAGMIGLLLDTPLNAEQRDLAISARASADALLAIINNILHVSRLESGQLSVAVADFDVVTTVERVVEVMRIAAQEKGLELKTDYDAALPAVLRGDPGRYRQVVVNLLTNAIKFTEKGHITVRMGVERETETHTLVRMSVSDTGPGIPQAARAQMFQPFFQVDASSTRKHSGMGLGLTITRQLVELMGGMLDYDSTPGEGSTFWFTIPFEKRAADRLPAQGARLAFPGARVLIVDQTETNRRLVQGFVASWGMRSRLAADESEALERLRTEAAHGDPYQVVIFDQNLAPNGGLALARAIKSDPAIAQTGLVMQTFLGDHVDDQELRGAGVSAYLAKPVDKSELFDCMTAALARETLRREIAEPAVQAHARAATQPPPQVPPEVRERVRILLAEDKPLNQKLTLSQLRSLGYTADAVSNGSEVIDALSRKEYDIILMDCQMPLMDGYETTMEIRRREKNGRRTKIIAMTANALEGDREKCLAAGMDDYLSKPTKREDLDAALARAYAARDARAN